MPNLKLRTALWRLAFAPGLPTLLAAQDSTIGKPAGADVLFDQVPTVTAASRFAQGTAEAPASISVITAEEIHRFGYRTIAEVLTSVRGIYTSNDRNYTYLGLRGFAETGNYNNRVLVLVDGHRLNEPQADAVYLGLESSVAIDDVERVEVIRGPGSSLYGTNALLGVINIITRKPGEGGLRVTGEGGSLGTYRGRVAISGNLGRVSAMMTGTYLGTSGATLAFPELASAQLPGGRVSGADGEQSGNVLTKVTDGTWTAMVGFGRRRKEIPTGSYSSIPGDPGTFTVDWRAFGFVRYDAVRENLDRVSVKVAVDGYGYHGSYAYPGELNCDYQRSRWVSMEGQYVHSVGRRHRLLAGGELRLNRALDQGANAGVRAVFSDHHTSTVAAVFLQDEIRLTRAVVLNLGLRHDRYGTFGGTTNPRAALIVAPRSGTTIKALVGRAFRAPSSYELYYTDGSVTQKPALALNPERVTSIEVVGEQSLGRTARLTVSGYRLRLNDGIALATDVSDSLLVFRNGGRAEGAGLEIELEGNLAGAVDARMAYTRQRLIDRDTRLPLLNTPRDLFRVGVSAPIGRTGFAIGSEFRAVGSRFRDDSLRVSGYLIGNITVTWQRSSRIDWGASLFNFLNQRYADPGGAEHVQVGIPQDGRTVRLWASVRL